MTKESNAVQQSLDQAAGSVDRFGVARLALEDGSIFEGRAFGASDRGVTRTAEVVFNTAMTGYQEALTDPSYSGQILVMTAPLVGNTGINREDVESVKVQVSGFVVRELTPSPSNYRSTLDLSGYLREAGVLGITGIDTRALTRRLRMTGVMRGVLSNDPALSDAELVATARGAESMAGANLVPLVGCTTSATWKETLGEWSPEAQGGKPHRGRGTSEEETHGDRGATQEGTVRERPLRVLALDCGAKRNILRNLADRGCEVQVVPHDISADAVQRMFNEKKVDGLFISNGPGDPAAVEKTIATLRKLVGTEAPAGGPGGAGTIPTFGICLGHQLLGLALGAKTFKLKFGHRGSNQPVLNRVTGKVEITSQNHGFAVEPESLKKALGGKDAVTATHVHLNDGTLAGLSLRDRPVFSVQYHPEASPGPHDSGYLFDAFVHVMRERKPLTLEMYQRIAGVER